MVLWLLLFSEYYLIQKTGRVENKIPDHTKYITTQAFNKLTAENYAARLKQANLLSKTDFDNELMSFNRNINSNKTKYLEVQKKLNSLTTKDYNFFGQNLFYKQWRISNHVCLSTNTWSNRILKIER